MTTPIQLILIEDDEDIRELVCESLQLNGFCVRAASSAEEFFRLHCEHSYDIAIVDIGLPDRPGHDIIRYINTHQHSKGIIVVSAKDSSAEKIAAYSNGADIYLSKPIELTELSLLIRNLKSRLDTSIEITQANTNQNWAIDMVNWRLTIPHGRHCHLTAKEVLFLSELMHGDASVARDKLLDALNYANNEYGHRSLESLVRRLRKKIQQQTNSTAPIKTVHGRGYSFTGQQLVSFE